MAEGQFTGRKRAYVYISDTNDTYIIRRDATLGDLAGADLELATTSADGVNKPTSFSPRGVHWEGILNGRVVRKFLICNRTGEFYQLNQSVALTIDDVPGFITGRKGEVASFIKVEPPVAL